MALQFRWFFNYIVSRYCWQSVSAPQLGMLLLRKGIIFCRDSRIHILICLLSQRRDRGWESNSKHNSNRCSALFSSSRKWVVYQHKESTPTEKYSNSIGEKMLSVFAHSQTAWKHSYIQIWLFYSVNKSVSDDRKKLQKYWSVRTAEVIGRWS